LLIITFSFFKALNRFPPNKKPTASLAVILSVPDADFSRNKPEKYFAKWFILLYFARARFLKRCERE
jgi:hypothetical protein